MKSQMIDVPEGKIAAVVTHLQMLERPATPSLPDVGAELVPHDRPDPSWYRDLFTRVGRDWLWFSRLGMSGEELTAILHRDDVFLWSVRVDGRDEGMLELDFREPGHCELAYFGLTPDVIGRGMGRWLMAQAIDRAWNTPAHPIRRFHVHTCTLDSPQALPFYIRSGFVPYRRQVEIADDPRMEGVLPQDAASHEPLI